MKRLAILSLIAAGAAAAHADTFFDQARVRTVEPQYENVTVPRQECSNQVVNEVRRVEGGRDYTGVAVGGVAGALLGNQVGKGHGREAATAVGAVVGALAGDNIAGRGRPGYEETVPREVTTCRTVNDVQARLTGYRVTYEYRGQVYTTVLRENPGHMMRVRVSVDPA